MNTKQVVDMVVEDVVKRYVQVKKVPAAKQKKIVALLQGHSLFTAHVVCCLVSEMVASKQSRKLLMMLSPDSINGIATQFSMYDRMSDDQIMTATELFGVFTREAFAGDVGYARKSTFAISGYVQRNYTNATHTLLMCLMSVAHAGFCKKSFPRWQSYAHMVASVLRQDGTSVISANWFYDKLIHGVVVAAYAREFFLNAKDNFEIEYEEWLFTASDEKFNSFYLLNCCGFGIVELNREKEVRDARCCGVTKSC